MSLAKKFIIINLLWNWAIKRVSVSCMLVEELMNVMNVYTGIFFRKLGSKTTTEGGFVFQLNKLARKDNKVSDIYKSRVCCVQQDNDNNIIVIYV